MKFNKFEKGMKGAVFEFGREFFLQRLEIMPVRSSDNFFPEFFIHKLKWFWGVEKGGSFFVYPL